METFGITPGRSAAWWKLKALGKEVQRGQWRGHKRVPGADGAWWQTREARTGAVVAAEVITGIRTKVRTQSVIATMSRN